MKSIRFWPWPDGHTSSDACSSPVLMADHWAFSSRSVISTVYPSSFSSNCLATSILAAEPLHGLAMSLMVVISSAPSSLLPLQAPASRPSTATPAASFHRDFLIRCPLPVASVLGRALLRDQLLKPIV